MASPTPEVFTVYDNTGTPLPGVAGGMSFLTYVTEAGVAITPQPTIVDIGGGLYKFTPTVPPSGHGTCYVLSTGHQPAFYSRFIRPEDYNTDQIPDIRQFLFGKAQIMSTGPDANRLLIYAADGTTVLVRFALADIAGLDTIFNPMKRTPV